MFSSVERTVLLVSRRVFHEKLLSRQHLVGQPRDQPWPCEVFQGAFGLKLTLCELLGDLCD